MTAYFEWDADAERKATKRDIAAETAHQHVGKRASANLLGGRIPFRIESVTWCPDNRLVIIRASVPVISDHTLFTLRLHPDDSLTIQETPDAA